MKEQAAGMWERLKKYRSAAAVVVLGVVLMLLPGGGSGDAQAEARAAPESFDRAAVQEEMETILRAIDGVGELRLMLTVDSGTRRELAQNISEESRGEESVRQSVETVVVGSGSGVQEAVVTNSIYPRYVGALVVCEGADSAAVRLAVTNAVSALTGLTSDKISVEKGRP